MYKLYIDVQKGIRYTLMYEIHIYIKRDQCKYIMYKDCMSLVYMYIQGFVGYTWI